MAYGDVAWAQDLIQNQLEADTNTPAITEDEWSIRLSDLNLAVRTWAEKTRWKELWTTLSGSSPGSPDLTTTASDSTYAVPSDFVEPGGFVTLTSSTNVVTSYPVVPPEQGQLHDASDIFAYFTGSPKAGYTLNLHPAPTVTGSTIAYDYYKRPSVLTAEADLLDMPRPEYAVHYSLSRRYQNQRDLVRSTNALDDANEILEDMEISNQLTPPYQDGGFPDLLRDQGVGFGG